MVQAVGKLNKWYEEKGVLGQVRIGAAQGSAVFSTDVCSAVQCSAVQCQSAQCQSAQCNAAAMLSEVVLCIAGAGGQGMLSGSEAASPLNTLPSRCHAALPRWRQVIDVDTSNNVAEIKVSEAVVNRVLLRYIDKNTNEVRIAIAGMQAVRLSGGWSAAAASCWPGAAVRWLVAGGWPLLALLHSTGGDVPGGDMLCAACCAGA
jgi:hypothetical protein